jgi:hypothetical protein
VLSEDREVYEIIASLPIDYGRVNALKDITFEAELLINSKFVKKIRIDYEGFKKLHEYSDEKKVLLTTEIDAKRFLIYMEKGRIVSTVMSDPEKGERIVGLRPLATLITISKQQPVVFKLFEIHEESEDRTRETPSRIIREITERRVSAVKTIEKEARREKVREEGGKPRVVEFVERLLEFKKKAQQMIEDTASIYGCHITGLNVNVSRGYVIVSISVRKKGFFGKCKADKLREILGNDLELLLTMHDISLPLKLEIKLEQ